MNLTTVHCMAVYFLTVKDMLEHARTWENVSDHGEGQRLAPGKNNLLDVLHGERLCMMERSYVRLQVG